MRKALSAGMLVWYFAVIAPGGGSVSVVGPFSQVNNCEKVRVAVVTEILRAAGKIEVGREDVLDAVRVPQCWSADK